MNLNKVKQRLLFLSPVVQAGWEKEACLEDFEKVSDLGQGAFGLVTAMRHKNSNITYAIKQMKKKSLYAADMIEQVKNEIRIMYTLNHDNIIKLFNHFEDDEAIYLVIEYAPGGQLWGKLQSVPSKRFTEKEVASYIKDLVSALEYLHGKGIIHRDIKPENLLLCNNGRIKLADFGWSNYLKPNVQRTTFCGTLDYLAPEMLTGGHQHDHMVDVWGLGVLIYELLTGKAPFSPSTAIGIKEMQKITQENIINVNFEYPKDFPGLAKDLVSKILKKHPKTRLNLCEIKDHPWVKCHAYIARKNELNKKALVETATFGQNMAQQKKFARIENQNQNVAPAFTEDEIIQIARPDSMLDKASIDVDVPDMHRAINKKVADFKLHMKKLEDENTEKLNGKKDIPTEIKSSGFKKEALLESSSRELFPTQNIQKEEYKELIDEITKLRNENAELKNENNKLREREFENINLKGIIAELQKKIEEHEKEKLDIKKVYINKDIVQLNQKVKSEDLNNFGRQIDSNEDIERNSDSRIQEMEKFIEILKSEIISYEKLMKSQYTPNVQDTDKDKKRMLEDINSLQVLCSMKQDRIIKLEAKIKDLYQQLNNKCK